MKCPTCNRSNKLEIVGKSDATRAKATASVKCPNPKCLETYDWTDEKAHLRKCMGQEKPCHRGCGGTFDSLNPSNHHCNECPKKRVMCSLCLEGMERHQFADHSCFKTIKHLRDTLEELQKQSAVVNVDLNHSSILSQSKSDKREEPDFLEEQARPGEEKEDEEKSRSSPQVPSDVDPASRPLQRRPRPISSFFL